jgi:hypothetical protein
VKSGCLVAIAICWFQISCFAEDDEYLLQQGNAASAALFGELMSVLNKTMQEKGIVEAIAFCRLEALPLTAQTAATLDQVKSLRRIGVRTRNPENHVDEIDREVLEEFLREWDSMEPPAPRLRSVEDSGGAKEIRYYRPIPVAASCLACHGAEQDIEPSVLHALSKQYPRDEAVGFSEGDLRGAIVVSFDPEADSP